MTLREACETLLAAGCTNLWWLGLWERTRVQPIDLGWADLQEAAQQRSNPGTYDLVDRTIVFVQGGGNGAGKRYRIWSAA